MPNGLGQMIQMLSALSEMQDRKHKMAIEEHQLSQQNEQFLAQLGVTKDDQRFKALSKGMDMIASGGAQAGPAAFQLAQSLGLGEQDAQTLAHMAPNATAALQQVQAEQEKVRTRSMQNAVNNQEAGQAAMNPEARMRMQIEAANMANTQHDSGQLSTSALISQMADRGASSITPGSPNYSADMARRIGEGYMIQTATRETPQQFDQGQAFINRGMGPAAASVAAGLTPHADAMLAASSNQAEIIARLAAARQGQTANISDTVGGINALHQIAKDLADKKYADKNTANTMLRQYNALAALLSGQGVQVPPLSTENDAPSALNRLQIWMNSIGGSAAPPSIAPSVAGRGGPLPGGVGGGAGGGGTGPRGY